MNAQILREPLEGNPMNETRKKYAEAKAKATLVDRSQPIPCAKCGAEKPASEFGRSEVTSWVGGYPSRCRACERERNRARSARVDVSDLV